MGGNSISKKLLEYFQYDGDTATLFAFIQQRWKNLRSALEFIFNEFTDSIDEIKIFNGYRLFYSTSKEQKWIINPYEYARSLKESGKDNINRWEWLWEL